VAGYGTLTIEIQTTNAIPKGGGIMVEFSEWVPGESYLEEEACSLDFEIEG